MTTRGSSNDQDWHVFSLCAAWCGVCGQWRNTFEELARDHPEKRFEWIDIEDEADVLGDLEIETFPTLLVSEGRQPRFFGPVLPSAAQCRRLLASLEAQPGTASMPPEVQSLLQGLLNRG